MEKLGTEAQSGIIGVSSAAVETVSTMPLPETTLTFLRRPNPAVMATVTSDGRPVSVATWYLIEDDGLLLLCMNDDRARLRHLKNNGHVSLTVLAADDFGTHVSVQGRVVSIKPDDGLTDIGRLSRHFLGRDYPARDRPLVTVHVEIDRWFGWSGGHPLQH
ncbi:PPOX class probable F420-dependent enzyme [Arthrobacter sp. SLBN-53]|nr:PPOX class probable F420-dependent enzyme [Arthrobacter sp. SLBN-53]